MTRTSPTIQLTSDPRVLLDLTLSLRMLDPIGTNQIASIASGIVTGARPADGHHFYVVTAADDNTQEDRVTSFALYSQARGILLSPTMSPEEAASLGELVANTVDPLLGEVVARNDSAMAFNVSYCRQRSTSTTAVAKRDLILYALGALRHPSSVAGAMRIATASDLQLLTAWTTEFFEYILAPVQGAAPFAASGIERGAIFLWEVEGKPVGFASFAPPVDVEGETVYRIGSVFVSPTERRKGYASSLTGALSRRLQETNTSRSSRVCLFADAANPAANKAYQNVGFELHGRFASYSYQTSE